MPISARELAASINDKVSLPDAVVAVNRMVNDPHFSAADIGETICHDKELTARLLRITNSPFFGFPSHINNVHLAVTIIGNQEMRDLLLAMCVIDAFDELPNELVSMETFWRHSLRCGVIARSLASYLHVPNVERYFTAGLLHDVGSLLINYQLPTLAKEILKKSSHQRQRRFILEQEELGFSHAELGGEILRLWKLPDYLIESVTHHHTPRLAKHFPHDAAIAHIANYLSNTMLTNIGENVEISASLDIAALQTTGLSPNDLQVVLKHAEMQFDETLEILVYDQVA